MKCTKCNQPIINPEDLIVYGKDVVKSEATKDIFQEVKVFKGRGYIHTTVKGSRYDIVGILPVGKL